MGYISLVLVLWVYPRPQPFIKSMLNLTLNRKTLRDIISISPKIQKSIFSKKHT